ncbi:MAG: response regulator, partial [Pseudomonadota bacterium]
MKSKNESVLVVDDSPAVLTAISEMLAASGYAVDTAPDGETGTEMINSKFYDIILTDLVMPGMDGMEVLKYVSDNSQESICIMVTGHGTIKSAVE